MSTRFSTIRSEGFEYEEGYEYELEVLVQERENVPADASAIYLYATAHT